MYYLASAVHEVEDLEAVVRALDDALQIDLPILYHSIV